MNAQEIRAARTMAHWTRKRIYKERKVAKKIKEENWRRSYVQAAEQDRQQSEPQSKGEAAKHGLCQSKPPSLATEHA